MLVPQVSYAEDLPRAQQTFSVELAWTDVSIRKPRRFTDFLLRKHVPRPICGKAKLIWVVRGTQGVMVT